MCVDSLRLDQLVLSPGGSGVPRWIAASWLERLAT